MSDDRYSVEVKNISKTYKMYTSPKQKLIDLISPKGAGKNFNALKNVSFNVEKGEVVGLLGLNGSGKSTLSNILGGVSLPTVGEVELKGETSLIAISLGLNGFLTGIENIEVKAIMMGYKKDEIKKIINDVIEFADIGDFINQPIRTYSSGMKSRLGFAIAVNTDPDILVIDEALSVGDPTFTQKCLDKMNEFKERGKTIFFVSHSISQVQSFCSKAIWLEYGTLKLYGDIDEVIPEYKAYINMINKMSSKERAEYKKSVLKEKEHSLLSEVKLVDPELKKVNAKGKLINVARLVNDKLEVKNIFYKFDYSTLALGFIPSLIRKKYNAAITILLLQILNFIIVPFNDAILTNFILTAVAAIFTGSRYVETLIENNGYRPYHIWKKDATEADVKIVDNKLKKNSKEDIIKAIGSILIVLIMLIIYVF